MEFNKFMDNMQNMGGGMKNMCKCVHHKVVPILVILFGALFLLGNWEIMSWDAVNMLWPILVIIGGVMKLTKGKCKCC